MKSLLEDVPSIHYYRTLCCKENLLDMGCMHCHAGHMIVLREELYLLGSDIIEDEKGCITSNICRAVIYISNRTVPV